MKIINVCSGSKGNTTLFEYKPNTYFQIDAGFAGLMKKINTLNISIDDIKYLFITHCHSDHILNINKYNEEIIYTGKDTIKTNHNNLEYFTKYDFDGFSITPIKTSHDVPNPMGFIINIGDTKIGYITDTGKIPSKSLKFLYNCNILFIESNYDVGMLNESNRPKYLIKRIKSNKGHLSNIQCIEYLKKIIGENTKIILLSHRSEDCNSEEKILQNLNIFKNIEFKILKQRENTIFDY